MLWIMLVFKTNVRQDPPFELVEQTSSVTTKILKSVSQFSEQFCGLELASSGFVQQDDKAPLSQQHTP